SGFFSYSVSSDSEFVGTVSCRESVDSYCLDVIIQVREPYVAHRTRHVKYESAHARRRRELFWGSKRLTRKRRVQKITAEGRLTHSVDKLQRRGTLRSRVPHDHSDFLSVRPVTSLTDEDVAQLTGRDIVNGVRLVDHDHKRLIHQC